MHLSVQGWFRQGFFLWPLWCPPDPPCPLHCIASGRWDAALIVGWCDIKTKWLMNVAWHFLPIFYGFFASLDVLAVFLGNLEAAAARNFPTLNLSSTFSLIQSQVLAFRCTSFSHFLHLSGRNLHPPEEEQMARAYRPITASPAKKLPCQGLGDIGVVDRLTSWRFNSLNFSILAWQYRRDVKSIKFHFPSPSR